MNRRSWIVAGVGAILLAGLGAGAVMAQSPEATTGSFLDRVAQKLGIEPQKLQDAVRDTRNEDIDAAVERGDFTQERADALKKKLEAAPDGGPFPLGGRGFNHEFKGEFRFKADGMGPGFAFGFGLPAGEGKLAEFLGITTDQLRTELQAEGATLATVAEAHGKSRDDLKSFISDNLNAKLDEAVQNQDLTQKKADEIKARTSEALDGLLDATIGRFGRGHRGPFPFDHGFPPEGADPGATPPLEQRGSLDPLGSL